MRKHTGDAQQCLQDHLILAYYQAEEEWHNLQEDVAAFKSRKFSNQDAYGAMGELWAGGVITSRSLHPIKKLWQESALFPERNLWSMYNCVTEMMKGLPPQKIMMSHLRLHSWARDRIGR